ncbi:MAG: hypothetical protein FJ160_02580 [Gammaproteobacteria bacterium]|nr:hypothetical protein [Gammaproteobacteria bacterium]
MSAVETDSIRGEAEESLGRIKRDYDQEQTNGGQHEETDQERRSREQLLRHGIVEPDHVEDLLGHLAPDPVRLSSRR